MTTTETIQGLAKKTAEMNAAFDAADDAGKRVIIAKDVIAALLAKQIVPTSGRYLALDGKYSEYALKGRDAEGSFRDLLATLPPCEVCAKGALFVCTVARRNQVTTGQAFRSSAEWLFDDATRMTMIMQNIITNGGEFRPELG